MTLATTYEVIKIFERSFFWKSVQAVIISYNALEHVNKVYNKFRNMVTNYEFVIDF